MFKQNWMASSEKIRWRPQLPMAWAHHCMSLSNQMVSAPLRL